MRPLPSTFRNPFCASLTRGNARTTKQREIVLAGCVASTAPDSPLIITGLLKDPLVQLMETA